MAFHILYASAVALTDRFPSLCTAISIPLWSILGGTVVRLEMVFTEVPKRN